MLARVFLGCMYDNGDGVEKDQAKAFAILLPAIAEGYVLADLHVGMDYFFGEGTEKNYEKAVEHLERVVEFDERCEFPQAQYRLGLCHKNGKGTKKNRKRAFDWYQKAAAEGWVPAMNDLGIFYGDGVMGEENPKEAFEWFQKASADESYAPALRNLAKCYEEGYGTEVNAAEAKRLLELAEKLEKEEK